MEVVFCLLDKSWKYTLGRERTQNCVPTSFSLVKREVWNVLFSVQVSTKSKSSSQGQFSTLFENSSLKTEVNKTFFLHRILITLLLLLEKDNWIDHTFKFFKPQREFSENSLTSVLQPSSYFFNRPIVIGFFCIFFLNIYKHMDAYGCFLPSFINQMVMHLPYESAFFFFYCNYCMSFHISI